MSTISKPPVIMMKDKRASRLDNRMQFESKIVEFNESISERTAVLAPNTSNITVMVRKRPMFQKEIKAGDFDVVSCLKDSVVVHQCQMRADLHHMFIKRHSISFDCVFSSDDTNEIVAPIITDPLASTFVSGKHATVIMFGQTGSGKTYTTGAVHERFTSHIFTLIPAGTKLNVIAFEMAGSQCTDLLNDGRVIQLLESDQGDVVPHLAKECEVGNAEELISILQHASSTRMSCATAVHDQSSRTHAFYRITFACAQSHGSLTIVDLSGSERAIDSDKHDVERMREASQINLSLMTLKDCLRIRASIENEKNGEGGSSSSSAHIPFRRSKLTMFLRRALTSEAVVTVVATISPISANTEHSLNSIGHVRLMKGESASDGTVEEVDVPIHAGFKEVELTHPKKWDNASTQEWWAENRREVMIKLGQADAGEEQDGAKLPANISGKDLMRWAPARFASQAGFDPRLNGGELLRKRFRASIDQVSAAEKARRDEIRASSYAKWNMNVSSMQE